MNALNNPLTHAFFDDMAEIGAFKWLSWAFGIFLIGYFGGDIIPYGFVIGCVFAVNLALAGFVSLWWEKRGREKYATGSIVDIGRAIQNQRGKDD